MNILVKSGIEQLPLFEKEIFSSFEAYLRGDEDMNKLLQTKMKLVAIHMPHFVEYLGQRWPVDFADKGTIGEVSFQKLKEIVDFSSRQDVSYVVVHLGFFNMLTEDRWKSLARMGKKFRALDNKKVKICLENVPCWVNICFENEPLISTAEHFLYLKERCSSVEAVLDVDHLAINTTFNHFYNSYREKHVSAENKKKFRSEVMEPEIQSDVSKNLHLFKELIDKELIHFLSLVKPVLVHAVGSDCCNYRHDEGKLPLLGEALPLGFKGIIKGFSVEDRLDHVTWISRIPKDTLVTIELMLRPEYDYIYSIRKNYDFLESSTS